MTSVETVITGEGVMPVKSPMDPCSISWAQDGDVSVDGGIIAEGTSGAGSVNQLVGGRPDIMVNVIDSENVCCWSITFRISSSLAGVAGWSIGRKAYRPVTG